VRVAQKAALAQRVGRMDLPRVFGVHRAEGGVDAAGGQDSVRVGAPTLADDEHVDAVRVELDRRAQARAAGADHQRPDTAAPIRCLLCIHTVRGCSEIP